MRDRLDVLDGWRALSVALVVISHFGLYANSSLSGVPNPEVVTALHSAGAAGVEIFFVISGFVICRGLIREATGGGRVSLIGFYVRRFFRIVPPLALYVATVCLLAQAGMVVADIGGLLRALTFTCNFVGTECGGYLGAHTWSLSVEEQFYLVIPALFLPINAHRRVATLLLISIPSAMLFTPMAGSLAGFLPIGVGVVCALHEARLRSLCERAPDWLVYVAMIALILATRLTYTRLLAPAYIATAFLIAAILMLSIIGKSRFAQMLSVKWLTVIGRASYAIYLWQQLATYPVPGAGISFYALSITLCVGGSVIMFALVERRLIAFGRELSRSLRVQPVSPLPAAQNE